MSRRAKSKWWKSKRTVTVNLIFIMCLVCLSMISPGRLVGPVTRVFACGLKKDARSEHYVVPNSKHTTTAISSTIRKCDFVAEHQAFLSLKKAVGIVFFKCQKSHPSARGACWMDDPVDGAVRDAGVSGAGCAGAGRVAAGHAHRQAASNCTETYSEPLNYGVLGCSFLRR